MSNLLPAGDATRNDGTGARVLGRTLGISLAVPVLVAVVLTLFVWPSLRADPRGLDLAVVGSSRAVQDMVQALDQAQPGAFDIVAVPDAAAARLAVRDRDVVGALVPGEPVTVLTASAGSAVVGQIIQGAAHAVSAGKVPPIVEDVAPAPAGDPRGVVLTGGLLPLIIAGIALGATLGQQRIRAVVGVLGVAIGAGASGLLLVAVMQTWLDALGGSYLANAAGVALAVAAVALPVLGMRALLGTPGIAVIALTMIILGNPLSGAATSPDLLPQGIAQVGQLLPPGATASLLRSTSGFDGAGSAAPAAVLAAWSLAGLAVVVFSALHRRRSAPTTAREDATDAPRDPLVVS